MSRFIEISLKSFFRILAIVFFANLQFANADSLTLFLTPARPEKVDWETPKGLLKSALTTTIKNRLHSIGHVNVHLECENVDILTGATSAPGKKSAKLVLKEGSGIGVLFYDLPGRHENREEVLADFKKLSVKEGRLASVRFEIRPETCQRLVKYHSEYIESGLDYHYGLTNRPRFREGGGCSAFAASFVDVAGLLDGEMKGSWSGTVLVPEGLIGYPINPTRISYLKALNSELAERWAAPWEPHRKLFFYEPEYMYQWILKLADELESGHTNYKGHSMSWDRPNALSFVPQYKNKTVSIAIDMTDLPTPLEPIFLN